MLLQQHTAAIGTAATATAATDSLCPQVWKALVRCIVVRPCASCVLYCPCGFKHRLEMVIAESGGRQAPRLDADEEHPDGVYFTAHK